MIPQAVCEQLLINTKTRQALKRLDYRVRKPRGTPNRNVMFQYEYEGIEYTLHATKGWRFRAV